MGLLTDFFIATPTEIQGVDIERTPVGSFPGLHAKQTDPVKLVQLQCCIDGSTFEERMPLLDEMLVRDAGQEGPWIFRVPQTLSDALASASPADIQTHGKAWATTDEWRADGGTEAELVPYLANIARLASEARAKQKALYVWMCL